MRSLLATFYGRVVKLWCGHIKILIFIFDIAACIRDPVNFFSSISRIIKCNNNLKNIVSYAK